MGGEDRSYRHRLGEGLDVRAIDSCFLHL